MQTAMMLMDQKPTQRARKINSERSEGLPGYIKSVGCVERSVENLRDPEGSWQEAGRPKTFRDAEGGSVHSTLRR